MRDSSLDPCRVGEFLRGTFLQGQSYYIRTFGCQMNEQDSLRMAFRLEQAGCRPADAPEEADILIVNTCSIRRKAEEKAYSLLGRFRRLKEKRPEIVVVVGGCVAQQSGESLLERMPHIDIVSGPHHVSEIDRLVESCREGRKKITALSMMNATLADLDCPGIPGPGGIKAYVTIMEGCNNFCSFCVVPFVRGAERSRRVESLLAEVGHLVERKGVKEITLLGQNVNAYRAPERGGYGFPELLKELSSIAGLERLRFTTCHPKDLSKDLIGCFGRIESLCEHIHVPLQSGSDRVLASMNRGYTAAAYLDRIQALRDRTPGIAITSDMIVGFPGEHERDFEQTLDRLREIRFDSLYSFKFSPRPGTRAAQVDDDVPAPEKSRRLRVLQEMQSKITLEINRELEGTVQEVLVEGQSRDGGQWMGRTRTNKIVNFTGFDGTVGGRADVMIQQALANSLLGRVGSLVDRH